MPAPQETIITVTTPLLASSTGAASALTATLTAPADRRAYISGFVVTGAGATAGSVINVTVTGLGTTLNFYLVIPAGAGVSINPLSIEFPVPIPASAIATNIVVNVPSFGTGNTNAAVAAFGYAI